MGFVKMLKILEPVRGERRDAFEVQVQIIFSHFFLIPFFTIVFHDEIYHAGEFFTTGKSGIPDVFAVMGA